MSSLLCSQVTKKKKKKLHPVSRSITYKSIILHSKARIWGRKNKNKKSGDCISGSTPLLHTRLEPLSLYKEARGKRDEQVDLYCVESNSPFAQLCSATLNTTEIKRSVHKCVVLTNSVRQTLWKHGALRGIKSDHHKRLLSVGSISLPTSLTSFLFPHSRMTFSFSSHVWVTFSTPTPGACFLIVPSLPHVLFIKPHPPLGFSLGVFHLYAEAHLPWPTIRWSPAASSLFQSLSTGKNCIPTKREKIIAVNAEVQYLASLATQGYHTWLDNPPWTHPFLLKSSPESNANVREPATPYLKEFWKF